MPEKFVVTFKPGKEMEERVRELERQAAAEAEAAHRAANSANSAASTDQTYSPPTTYEAGAGGSA